MGVQVVMTRAGDRRYTFTKASKASLARAEKRFLELTGSGFTAAEKLCVSATSNQSAYAAPVEGGSQSALQRPVMPVLVGCSGDGAVQGAAAGLQR